FWSSPASATTAWSTTGEPFHVIIVILAKTQRPLAWDPILPIGPGAQATRGRAHRRTQSKFGAESSTPRTVVKGESEDFFPAHFFSTVGDFRALSIAVRPPLD
ncbi:MAG: hypothetical protein IID35_08195, partial [Planctomycetes bacterium]|nr:hypothetical protein [Planctomycetota bacterium]